MPNRHTFSIPPIAEFVWRYLTVARVSIDPFCGEKRWSTHCNDLERDKVDAGTFLRILAGKNVKADLLIFDPPYSPRQISECYKSVGYEVGMEETQNGALYKRVRDAAMPLLTQDAIVLSFGWNSAGMGKGRGFEIIELLMVAHGGGHNDTICVAEKRLPQPATGGGRAMTFPLQACPLCGEPRELFEMATHVGDDGNDWVIEACQWCGTSFLRATLDGETGRSPKAKEDAK